MDIATLRWFQQVADGVTVTEVSELEGVSQPGVSRALARLDRELGTPLLRRSGRNLRMTRAGAAFKRHVDAMLHEYDDGLAALSELAAPDTGTVALSFQLSLGTWLVPRLVAGFRDRYPAVRFELHQLGEDDTAPALLGGRADLALTTVRPSDPSLRFRALQAEPLRLAVAVGHPLAQRPSVRLADVGEERFVVLRPGFALRSTADQLCRRAGFTPTVAFEGDDLPTVLGFVSAGLGIAIVPAPHGDSNSATSRSLRHLELVDDGAYRQIGLVWSIERPLLAAAERFRRHVLAAARARAV